MQNVTSDRVFFGTDIHTLDAEARAVLDTQAQWLLANPSVQVTIEGHADERGTREYNLALAERRPHSGQNYPARRGVPASRESEGGPGGLTGVRKCKFWGSPYS